jgi:hypothetical protein
LVIYAEHFYKSSHDHIKVSLKVYKGFLLKVEGVIFSKFIHIFGNLIQNYLFNF